MVQTETIVEWPTDGIEVGIPQSTKDCKIWKQKKPRVWGGGQVTWRQWISLEQKEKPEGGKLAFVEYLLPPERLFQVPRLSLNINFHRNWSFQCL